jgi:tetratricopeptide (TPR) repeat protein
MRALLCGLLVPALSCLAACGATRSQLERSEDTETVAPLVATAERAVAREDYDTAIASYGEAYARTPWNLRLKRALAAAYAERAAHSREQKRLGALRAAERDLRTALRLFPDDPALQRNLGIVLLEQAAREMDASRAGALREEARRYAPDVVEETPIVQVRLERRLDLAFELIELGKLEAAIGELERIHAEYPEHAGATRLLARAQVRKGTELAARANYEGAGVRFGRAVELYASLEHCRTGECERADLKLAHQNRITAWLNANRRDEARRALEDASLAGLRFPELRRELGID